MIAMGKMLYCGDENRSTPKVRLWLRAARWKAGRQKSVEQIYPRASCPSEEPKCQGTCALEQREHNSVRSRLRVLWKRFHKQGEGGQILFQRMPFSVEDGGRQSFLERRKQNVLPLYLEGRKSSTGTPRSNGETPWAGAQTKRAGPSHRWRRAQQHVGELAPVSLRRVPSVSPQIGGFSGVYLRGSALVV